MYNYDKGVIKLNLQKVLKQERENNNYTQKQVAELLHISQQAYAHYETGKREPTIDKLIKLADLYKVSIDFLVGRYK